MKKRSKKPFTLNGLVQVTEGSFINKFFRVIEVLPIPKDDTVLPDLVQIKCKPLTGVYNPDFPYLFDNYSARQIGELYEKIPPVPDQAPAYKAILEAGGVNTDNL